MADSLSSIDDDYPSDRDSIGGITDEEDDDDFQSTSTSCSSSQVITRASLLAAQMEDLRRVMDVLTLSEKHARTLLIYHRWEIERVLGVFLENGKDQLFSEAGINVLESKDIAFRQSSSLPTCNVCMEGISFDAATTMDCGYCFCNDLNTKPCPTCNKPVEKNGGCNLVICICGQSFCWLCAGATGRVHTWSSIDQHSCGQYKVGQRKNSERSKWDLYRYMHYYSRYVAHTDSFKLEGQLKETIQEKISNAENMDIGLKDFSWVMNGFHRLFITRRALSYSYPFAFYMFGDDLFAGKITAKERELKQHLFEDQQQQLEANVEKLSRLMEEPFDSFPINKVLEIRMEILNLSFITDKLCEKMYECIENELLGLLPFTTQYIAPYKSNGIKMASEISVHSNSDQSLRGGMNANITDSFLRGIQA